MSLRVAPVLHHLKSKGVSRIDDPDEEEPVLLQRWDGQVYDLFVAELGVPKSNSPGGSTRSKLPGRIHHDHVELAPFPELLRVR